MADGDDGYGDVKNVMRMIKDGGFDVLHVHEPEIPSLSLLACWVASGPIVATFHTAIPRSRVLLVTYPVVRTGLENATGDWQRFYARWQAVVRDRMDAAMFDLMEPFSPFVALGTPPGTATDESTEGTDENSTGNSDDEDKDKEKEKE